MKAINLYNLCILKVKGWVSPKTQLQAYPLKHTISQAYIKRKEYLSLL